MKPLSSYTYIKSNIKKTLPSFICIIVSVILVYSFGLLLYSSINDFYKLSTNISKRSTSIFTNSINKPISNEIINQIKNDENVSLTIPLLGKKNSIKYNAVFGIISIDTFIFYSEDVDDLLKAYDLKISEGRKPQDNKNEILLPDRIARQYNLKVGDYISKEFSTNISVDTTYKLVGITKGDVWLPIICDVGDIKREEAMNIGILFFFKDTYNTLLNQKLIALNDKSLVIQENKGIEEEMQGIKMSINFLYVSLNIIILLVLCISLGNLNYIVFLNRKSEFSILSTIGYKKSKLRRKLFKENAIVCLLGYIVGIVATIIIITILNITAFEPKGQYISIFRIDSLLISAILPILVSIFSMLSSVREFNKLSYESLNN